MELLGGPRGRRLCFELAREVGVDGRLLPVGPRSDLYGELAVAVATVDVEAVSRTRDPGALVPALADAVGWAMYWQEPDEVDTALSDPGLAALLRPLAGAVLASPASAWWTAPLAPEGQWHLRRSPDDPDLGPPSRPAAGDLLRRWHRSAVAEEQRAAWDRPTELTAMVSGQWWSTPVSWHPPASAQLASTTPALPGTDDLPAGLVLEEDSSGARLVEVRHVLVDPVVRVYEITGPAAWVELVTAYPLGVTHSRRHDWFRATGRRGTWTIPDWEAVARDWDGVHLTVEGYLSTAGRPLRLPDTDDAGTLLAGWDPGATWWLADVIRAGPPVLWTGPAQHPLGWTRVT
jgi:hypothetical protein